MLDLQPDHFANVPLAALFEAVDTGRLALPELQRPSVWQDTKVPELLDSVYRGFPLGVMLFWTPPAADGVRCRQWGFAEQSENPHQAEYFLLDGQQRLTALYRALHGKEQAEKGKTVAVAFDVIEHEFSLIDGQMQSKLKNPAGHGCYAVRDLLQFVRRQSAELREVVACHPSAKEVLASGGPFSRLIAANVRIAAHSIGERSYAEAVEIFARINRGTPVKRSQIVLFRITDRSRSNEN
jgi:hypothetical protein